MISAAVDELSASQPHSHGHTSRAAHPSPAPPAIPQSASTGSCESIRRTLRSRAWLLCTASRACRGETRPAAGPLCRRRTGCLAAVQRHRVQARNRQPARDERPPVGNAAQSATVSPQQPVGVHLIPGTVLVVGTGGQACGACCKCPAPSGSLITTSRPLARPSQHDPRCTPATATDRGSAPISSYRALRGMLYRLVVLDLPHECPRSCSGALPGDRDQQ